MANEISLIDDMDESVELKDSNWFMFSENGNGRRISSKNLSKNINNFESVTHEQLCKLISDNHLMTGKTYLINDFKTIYNQSVTNESMEGEIEPLLVRAISNNKLYNKAISTIYPDDEIWYDFEIDNQKYSWSNPYDKGQIYRRITKNNNDIPYDVRAIKFRRWSLNEDSYDDWSSSSTYDLGTIVKYNDLYFISIKSDNLNNVPDNNMEWWMKLCSINNTDKYFISRLDQQIKIENSNYSLNINQTSSGFIDFYTFDNGTSVNTVDENNVYENKFKSYKYDNKYFLNNSIFIGKYINSNTIGSNFNSNTIGDFFYSNVIKDNFYSNNIGKYFNSNTIGNNFYSNNIENEYFQFNFIKENINGKYFNSQTELFNKNYNHTIERSEGESSENKVIIWWFSSTDDGNATQKFINL